ncbi:MAG: hypothetical protein AAGH19_08530 [Pseudomonadota bacterium]
MTYRDSFDETIQAVLAPCVEDQAQLWPEHIADEGEAYGREQGLAAEEAATWYLSAAALIRMRDGALGVPLATRLLAQAQRVAQERGLSDDLLMVLAHMEQERHDWIAANHEFQGAGLRALRPAPADQGLAAHLDADFDDEFVPAPDWPDLLERLLTDHSSAPS